MTTPTFEEYSAQVRAKGCNEVLVREWGAGHATPTHEHPFDAYGLVVRGEFTLACGGTERLVKTGERFEVMRGTPHAEIYGPEGATFWVGRAG